jgi:lipoyl(octanoyl) transferase
METNNFLIITEHNPVYTIGKSGNISNLLLNDDEMKTQGIEFYKINRGGDITYHGPGQIMGYPIIDLDNFFTDINLYLRKLEEVIINTLKSYDLEGFTIKGETGVWVKDNNGLSKKVCAFGIRASRWVTMHGFSFNVNPELNYFKNIIPCGITDKGVTSVSELKNRNIEMNEIKQILYKNFAESFSAKLVFEN